VKKVSSWLQMSYLSTLIGVVGVSMEPAIAQIPSPSLAEPTPPVAPLDQPPALSECEITLAPADCETADDALGQVRSVEELTDVSPNDWAYQSLKSMIERYDLSLGYPDQKFRGNQPVTRYEFAAAVSQALDQLLSQLARQEFSAIREDYATLRRLQQSYSTISQSLDRRLTQLDTQMQQLEQQQFSVTTKLSGETVLAITDGNSASATLIARTRLNLNTSFNGRDRLLTQLEVGNNGGDAVSKAQDKGANRLGSLGLLAGAGGADYVGVESTVRLSQLHYTFQPIDQLAVTVGARLSPRDYIDRNRFANDPARDFSSSFFANNPLIIQNQVDRPGGAGLALAWQPFDLPLKVRALYVAADADATASGIAEGGLFGDRYQGSFELEYGFTDSIAARLQYTRAKVNEVDISAFGLNLEWAVNNQFAVFGRFGFGSYEGFNPLIGEDLDLNPATWAVGLIVRNIVIPGSTAGVAIGQPFIEADLGSATQTNFEAFYSFAFNDNIIITPALIVVDSADNSESSRTIWQGLLRLVFIF